MTFFGMLIDSPDSEFQRISPQKRQSRKERLSFDDESPMHSLTARVLKLNTSDNPTARYKSIILFSPMSMRLHGPPIGALHSGSGFRKRV